MDSTLVAPVIPVLTDLELERILAETREAGATTAEYILLRLPHEVKELFREWLTTHVPLKAKHVMERLKDCRGGKDYDARFGARLSGTGVFSDLLGQRFSRAARRLGFRDRPPLDISRFRPPALDGQLDLF